jgi:hypothetical protein
MNKTKAVAVRIHAVSPELISDDNTAGDRSMVNVTRQ